MKKQKKPLIIVTRAIPSSVADALSRNFSVKLNLSDTPFSQDQLKHALKNSDGILCTVSDQITTDIINSEGRRASIISNYGVGVSNIDITHCKKVGLTVTNTPNVLTDSTAEVALFLILAVSRRTTFLVTNATRSASYGESNPFLLS